MLRCVISVERWFWQITFLINMNRWPRPIQVRVNRRVQPVAAIPVVNRTPLMRGIAIAVGPV